MHRVCRLRTLPSATHYCRDRDRPTAFRLFENIKTNLLSRTRSEIVCADSGHNFPALHGQLPQYTWLKIVSSWLTSATNHCDRLMSWRVPHKKHERVSETGVFPSLDLVSGTLCLSHYVTEISHLYSLRNFWKHFDLCRAAANSDCCFFAPRTNILTYLLTYFLTFLNTPRVLQQSA